MQTHANPMVETHNKEACSEMYCHASFEGEKTEVTTTNKKSILQSFRDVLQCFLSVVMLQLDFVCVRVSI